MRRRGEGVSGIDNDDADAAEVLRVALRWGCGVEGEKHPQLFDPHDNFKQNALL